jgi:HipA-like protein
MLRTVLATRYVTPLRAGGSLPGLVEADDDGLYVVKFRAAGQGPKALIAEVVVGELARAAGLPVPELVLVEVQRELGAAEPDPEVNELITASAGLNAGLDFLPGSFDYQPGGADPPSPELAADVVWFDALTTNVDRTPRNPNLLIWHSRMWLIDHGAALYQHHGERPLIERAGDPFAMIAAHVLLPLAGSIAAADERLAPRLTTGAIDAALNAVPDSWLGEDAASARRAYADYFHARLSEPRAFVAEAERARGT